jgi:hypothetical protein
VVTLDGVQVGQTTATMFRTAALLDGPHTWQVTASNPAGLASVSPPATVFVDTVAPTVNFTILGRRRIGSRLHMFVTAVDQPPAGEPTTDASGVAKVTVKWSAHAVVNLGPTRHRSFHSYARPGRRRVTVTVTDRAGNTTRVVMLVTIKRKPRPHHKRPPHSRKPAGR